MDDCRKAFEEWWDVAGSQRAYGFDKDRQFAAWQSAWNSRNMGHKSVTVPIVDYIADVLESKVMMSHSEALELAIAIVENDK